VTLHTARWYRYSQWQLCRSTWHGLRGDDADTSRMIFALLVLRSNISVCVCLAPFLRLYHFVSVHSFRRRWTIYHLGYEIYIVVCLWFLILSVSASWAVCLSSAEAVTTVTPAAAADIQVNEPGMQLVVVVGWQASYVTDRTFGPHGYIPP